LNGLPCTTLEGKAEKLIEARLVGIFESYPNELRG
jgi:hypothetical protein